MKAGEPQQAAENKGAEGRRASRGGERGKSSEGGMEAEGEEREARDAARRLSGGMLCAAGGGPRLSHPLPGLWKPTPKAGGQEVASARASGSGDMRLNGGKSLFALSRRIC